MRKSGLLQSKGFDANLIHAGKNPVFAGLKHALEVAITQQQAALVFLDVVLFKTEHFFSPFLLFQFFFSNRLIKTGRIDSSGGLGVQIPLHKVLDVNQSRPAASCAGKAVPLRWPTAAGESGFALLKPPFSGFHLAPPFPLVALFPLLQ
ncbi:MAG: hypothetical protein V4772_19170 [Pseudomonadota bacterium]